MKAHTNGRLGEKGAGEYSKCGQRTEALPGDKERKGG